MCFTELVNWNFIQLDKYYDKCRVHDIILDFIISVSIKENFVTLVLGSPYLTVGTQNKVRRLSLQVGMEGNSVLPRGLILSHARSLYVFGHLEDQLPSLAEFRHLRVLSFQGCHNWLQTQNLANIGRLFQLRYLNMGSELPEEIGCLRYLETLDVRSTVMDQLPPCITRLENLEHLFIHQSVLLPDGIAKMQSLETLTKVNLSLHSSYLVKELGQLKNLRELILRMWNEDMPIDMCIEHMKTIASCLLQLGTSNLRHLRIDTLTPFDNLFLPDPWFPAPLKLQKLRIQDTPMARVPCWVGSLVDLKQLHLEVKCFGHEELCILGCLPSLLQLSLYRSGQEAGQKDRLVISVCYGFPFLRKFSLCGQEVMFAAGSMPRLEQLYLWLNTSKTMSLANGGFDIGMRNLPCLTTIRFKVYRHTGEEFDHAKAALERAVSSHPNQPTLEVL
uniref:Disease resistance R13L4/SHOC-2-like LRR domain-containing protein n=1 Tax=Oryza glumipatula TaxID=40148 RepID=A0A0E0AUT1_9ORYZ